MLRARVLTALVLLAGFLAALFWLPFSAWMVFAALVAAAGAWEWGGLIKLERSGRGGYAAGTLALGLLVGATAFDEASGAVVRAGPLAWILAAAVLYWTIGVPAWLAAKWSTPGGFPGMLIGWLVLIPASASLMQLRAAGPWVVLAVLAAVWVADIAAYFAGRRFGRHKLAPAISPGKTWEGLAAALIGVVVYGGGVAALSGKAAGLSAPGWLALAAALAVLTFVSVVGDLFESLIKRQAGVKDSGSLLPGHGGVLDRIDSLTSTLPAAGLTALFLEGRIQWPA
jgi:phosphatidate cytidylyltransferase